MIELKYVSEWIKTLPVIFEHYYIGTLDNKKDKSLGVYNLKREISPINAMGGIEYSSYNIKRVSLLVHWNKATDETENIANKLYEAILNAKPERIGKHKVQFIGMLNNEPMDVGRDDNGICEYVIELEIFYKRKEEV